MISLLYEPLPETVTADGEEREILTDYRDWIRFSDLMGSDLPNEDKLRAAAFWYVEPPARFTAEAFSALVAFYRADALAQDHDEHEEDDGLPRPPVLDWSIDAKYILGDFRRCYGLDLLRVEHLHWWEFRALLEALPDDAQIMRRVAYRGADLSQIPNEAERRRVARLQRRFALPFTYTDEMIGAMLWDAM